MSSTRYAVEFKLDLVKMKLSISVILLLLSTSASLAYEASFDCAKATTKVERLVCSDIHLAQLDSEMSRSFQKALDQENSLGNRERVKERQIQWLKIIRSRCSDASCLKEIYKKRVSQLNKQLAPDNCKAADEGLVLAIGFCLGSELEMEEQHQENLLIVLTKAFAESKLADFKKSQSEWRKNINCHCMNQAEGYNTGVGAIVVNCQLPMIAGRNSQIEEFLNGGNPDLHKATWFSNACDRPGNGTHQ